MGVCSWHALLQQVAAPLRARAARPEGDHGRCHTIEFDPQTCARLTFPAFHSAITAAATPQVASSPAVILMANPMIATLNANEMISWTISTRRMGVCVADTSAVWLAAAIVMEK